ncbi:Rne/Rng family ribonuclease [Peribacillus cavernae]|uniref:Rne/Rng family ribonuclease n=1 Tax=Peribacillus cavernae TaxID=1674310 RepID=A0A433HHF6_9BACI|nr:Rne/Rng family ribonuclease [Peribacillus cavernae]MDQ0219365.1 ribonuclease G [Peribacillus cavernae]RUQ27758.1 Rne/Rng family ribonuclease [Peribacillus cavernae]
MKKVIVNMSTREKRYAVTDNGKLVKLEMMTPNQQSLVGNIYLGKVTKVLPGMDAVFIDFGQEKNGFLHRDQLPSYQRSKPDPSATIGKFVRQGEKLLVQVTRDETGTKGAKLTGLIELSTEYIVYIHGIDYVGVSRKFADPHSQRKWRTAAFESKRADEGLIIRTSMETQDLAMFQKQLSALREQYAEIHNKAAALKSTGLLYAEDTFLDSIQREINAEEAGEVIIDNFAGFKELEERLSLQSGAWKAVYYKEKQNIFSGEKVEPQLERALKKIVWLDNGGYLIIEETEALTVIDVNTGKYTGKAEKEQTIFETNLQAASAAASQIRLRNIGGMILIDFINMEDTDHRRKIIEILKDESRRDEMRSTIVGFTELGILQLTRKKTSPSLSEKVTEVCPCCRGTGKIESAETIAFRLERELMEHRHQDEEAVWVEISEKAAKALLGDREAYRPTLEANLGMKLYITNLEGLHNSYVIKRFGSIAGIEIAVKTAER